jgi:DNA-binding transcriptional MerR regulator
VTDVTEMTVDELAQRAGMTVRNVRAHQSRGLLQPPAVRGRTGYYGPEHLARLEFIKELQAEGFNLESIRKIIENAPGASAREALDFTRALTAPFADEPPELAEAAELAEPWGDQVTPELVRKVVKLGFLRELGDGRFEVRSPRLQKASRELAELGVPLEAAIEVMSVLKRHSRAVATAYADLFIEQVWRPFEREGGGRSDWAGLQEALERLRPLAAQSLLAVFQMEMTDTVEEAAQRELGRLAKKGERRRRRGSRRVG